MLVMTFVSAAGASRIRRPVEQRIPGCAVLINPAGWVAAAIGGPQPKDAKLTWAEARTSTRSHRRLRALATTGSDRRQIHSHYSCQAGHNRAE